MRRRKIKFPDDCSSNAGGNEKNKHLKIVCAEALEAIKDDLPADEGCDFDNYRKDFYYETTESVEIFSYIVKETDTDGIEKLAERLGTTESVLRRYSRLNQNDALNVGQTLRYQKASRTKKTSSWLSSYLDDYGAKFYPLSANKYLVQLYCDAGAYNEINLYLLYDESAIPAKAKVLDFPYLTLNYGDIIDEHNEKNDVPDSIEKVKVKAVGGRWFDRKTKKLIVFVKAHGIGDAGRYARYSFPNGKPKLEEFRARIIWSGRGYQLPDVIKSPPKTWKQYYPNKY